ncbi:hypothetical protein ACFOEZ_08950 [Tianweitania populi]|uniref:Uncharacterized protein n=1 Tax=Tianweitania populi TaxID=1607949 RepID=A0A8J3GLI7_9HYPH|nr:hypothetical protein [Tianweitania populi]GHD12202.1 hypothetical protein GCM10016234_16160 [Tianweitania populi]
MPAKKGLGIFWMEKTTKQIFKPVETVDDFHTLDDGEILCGYLDGLRGTECPLADATRSYWHGWRNGLVDAGLIKADAAHLRLDEAFQVLREPGSEDW